MGVCQGLPDGLRYRQCGVSLPMFSVQILEAYLMLTTCMPRASAVLQTAEPTCNGKR